jgi:hypothetical protein
VGWGRFWFTRRDGVWHICGPLEDMQRAAATGTPIKVTKREGEVWVRFTTMPDGFFGDEAIQGDEQEWLWR